MKLLNFSIIIFLLFSIIFVFATERATISTGQSYHIKGKNVTLVNVNPIKDVAIFCVNNIKGIVSKERSRVINDAHINLIKAEGNEVSIRVDASCTNGCDCDETCNNTLCIEEIIESESDEINEEEIDLEEQDKIPEIIVVSKGEEQENIIIDTQTPDSKPLISGLSIAILFIIILILGIIVLWKKY